MAINSFMIEGQLVLRCSKPSAATTAFRFAGEQRKSKHAFFSPQQWCSASAKLVATMPTSMYLHSFSSQINFSLYRLYLSAATSRCWDMTSSSSFCCLWKHIGVHETEQSLETPLPQCHLCARHLHCHSLSSRQRAPP
uniref:Uncharacterized protein n=1 Tax=Arundo donax TaxID=35708 RepID=A0A0A9B6K1_ARUDO